MLNPETMNPRFDQVFEGSLIRPACWHSQNSPTPEPAAPNHPLTTASQNKTMETRAVRSGTKIMSGLF